jgi:hypothetical protein
MLIGYQIRNNGVDGPQISVDDVKESLRREIIAEFSKMNMGMMGTEMERKELLRRELLMGAGQDAKEYLREEMAAEINAAPKEKSGENMNERDDFVSSVNIVIARAGDVAPRGRQHVGKRVKVLDS